jgi:flagellar protein FlaG
MASVVNRADTASMVGSAYLPRAKTQSSVGREEAAKKPPQTGEPERAKAAEEQRTTEVGRSKGAAADDKVSSKRAPATGPLADLTAALGHDTNDTKLVFTQDKELNRVIVKVVDRDTEEVVREIPREEMLRAAKFMRRLRDANEALKGNLVRVVT